jgi:hypothetical protein
MAINDSARQRVTNTSLLPAARGEAFPLARPRHARVNRCINASSAVLVARPRVVRPRAPVVVAQRISMRKRCIDPLGMGIDPVRNPVVDKAGAEQHVGRGTS